MEPVLPLIITASPLRRALRAGLGLALLGGAALWLAIGAAVQSVLIDRGAAELSLGALGVGGLLALLCLVFAWRSLRMAALGLPRMEIRPEAVGLRDGRGWRPEATPADAEPPRVVWSPNRQAELLLTMNDGSETGFELGRRLPRDPRTEDLLRRIARDWSARRAAWAAALPSPPPAMSAAPPPVMSAAAARSGPPPRAARRAEPFGQGAIWAPTIWAEDAAPPAMTQPAPDPAPAPASPPASPPAPHGGWDMGVASADWRGADAAPGSQARQGAAPPPPRAVPPDAAPAPAAPPEAPVMVARASAWSSLLALALLLIGMPLAAWALALSPNAPEPGEIFPPLGPEGWPGALHAAGLRAAGAAGVVTIALRAAAVLRGGPKITLHADRLEIILTTALKLTVPFAAPYVIAQKSKGFGRFTQHHLFCYALEEAEEMLARGAMRRWLHQPRIAIPLNTTGLRLREVQVLAAMATDLAAQVPHPGPAATKAAGKRVRRDLMLRTRWVVAPPALLGALTALPL